MTVGTGAGHRDNFTKAMASLLLELFQGIRMKVSADEKHVQFTQADTPEQVYTHFIVE